MNDNHNDIKHLTRPQYDDLPPMSISDRAAQFSSFSALTGYDEMIDEEAREVDAQKAFLDEKMEILDPKNNRQTIYIAS